MLLALKEEARHTLQGWLVTCSEVLILLKYQKKIIWEIAQLIFKLLQKQLLKISSTKIKTLLSQKPPALQAAASKTQSTNSTGGHKSQRNL